MDYSFPETSTIATVLLIPPLKSNDFEATARTLAASFPDNFYLACEQQVVSPFYCTIPSIAACAEEEWARAKEGILCLGVRLGILPERCLLLPLHAPCFSKRGLQRHLVRRLKSPVRLLTITDSKVWLYGLGYSAVTSYGTRFAQSGLLKDKEKSTVKIRHLASSALF